MMVPATGSSEPPEDLIMSRALVAVMAMVSRARLMVSWSAAAALGAFLVHHADLHLDDLEGVVQLEVADLIGLAALGNHAGAAMVCSGRRRRAAGCGVEGILRFGQLGTGLLRGLADAQHHKAWQVPASRRRLTATTQPTTSFWLAAKMTATRKAMMTTVIPRPPDAEALEHAFAGGGRGRVRVTERLHGSIVSNARIVPVPASTDGEHGSFRTANAPKTPF